MGFPTHRGSSMVQKRASRIGGFQPSRTLFGIWKTPRLKHSLLRIWQTLVSSSTTTPPISRTSSSKPTTKSSLVAHGLPRTLWNNDKAPPQSACRKGLPRRSSTKSSTCRASWMSAAMTTAKETRKTFTWPPNLGSAGDSTRCSLSTPQWPPTYIRRNWRTSSNGTKHTPLRNTISSGRAIPAQVWPTAASRQATTSARGRASTQCSWTQRNGSKRLTVVRRRIQSTTKSWQSSKILHSSQKSTREPRSSRIWPS